MTTLQVVITSEGLQASIENSKDRNGFSIRINSVEIISGDKSMGRFPCTGILRGSNSITVNALVTGNERYDITQINLIDGISGKVFANVKRQDDGVIDTVNNGKLGVYVNIPVRFGTLEANIVTVVQEGNSSRLEHMKSPDAHSIILRNKLRKSMLVDNLTTESNEHFLAASQGFALKKYVEAIESKIMPSVQADKHMNHSGADVYGEVVKFADGYKIQTFKMIGVRIIDLGDAMQNGRLIQLPLWEGFERKILNVTVGLSNAVENRAIPFKGYMSHEADEWQFIWRYAAARDVLNTISLFAVRYLGSVDENVNVKIVVEGI